MHDPQLDRLRQRGATMDILDLAAATRRFRTLVTCLVAVDWTTRIQKHGPFTLLAPTDDAFSRLPTGTVSTLLSDTPALHAFLDSHLVDGMVDGTEALAAGSVETLRGDELRASDGADGLRLGSARVTLPDLSAANGILHGIDRVLLPREVDLIAPVTAHGLVTELPEHRPAA